MLLIRNISYLSDNRNDASGNTLSPQFAIVAISRYSYFLASIFCTGITSVTSKIIFYKNLHQNSDIFQVVYRAFLGTFE